MFLPRHPSAPLGPELWDAHANSANLNADRAWCCASPRVSAEVFYACWGVLREPFSPELSRLHSG